MSLTRRAGSLSQGLSRRVIIAGGSGFIGRALAGALLSRGDRVVVLSRRPIHLSGVSWHPWESFAASARAPASQTNDWTEHARVLNGTDAIINLIGRSVDCRKSPAQRREILTSRIDATHDLGQACRRVESPPPVWIQMSTAHIYGDPPNQVCDEQAPTGTGFAPDIGRAWEAAFEQSRLPAQRGVILRTAFVLGRRNAGGAGAMARLAWLARLGLGGRVATGTQGFSWIHEHDLHLLIDRAICDPAYQGVYNAAAPQPLTQVEFMRVVRRHVGGVGARLALPSPEWLVRLGARFVLRTGPELAIYGRYVVSTRLPQVGFAFALADLNSALQDCLLPGCPACFKPDSDTSHPASRS